MCICTQAIFVQQLIVVLGVSYTPAARPNYCVVTTLQDCIGLLVIRQTAGCRNFPPFYQNCESGKIPKKIASNAQKVTENVFLNLPPISNALGALRCTYRASLNVPVSLLKDP